MSSIMDKHIADHKVVLEQYSKDVLIDRILLLEKQQIEESRRLDSLDCYFGNVLCDFTDKSFISFEEKQRISHEKSKILYDL